MADLFFILILGFLFFGHRSLPSLGRSLGQGFRGFKKGASGDAQDRLRAQALNEKLKREI